MAAEDRLREYEESLSKIDQLPVASIKEMWIEYDKQNDILYINFGREEAEESIMLDNDVVVGIKDGRIVSITVFDFSRRVGL
ncbi:MAG: DUF2283 domain-containing protein [Desulfurococcales archaeon]|nr:DUF2283 domain-containing protein [Desulfurococcales archaeon]